jgi:23S rRNA (guanosine2251-2'-O)-methyltransferase
MIIYGFNAVKESVKSKRITVNKLYFSTKKLGFEVRGIPVLRKDRNFLNKLTKSTEHQGIAAEIDNFPYATLRKLLEKNTNSFNFVLLDRVNDPHNLGAAIRVCECAGVNGIIIGEKFGAKISPAVFKVSAGAAAYLPVILVKNPIDTVNMLIDNEFSIFSIENTINAINYKEAQNQLTNKNLFVFGSEGEGIASAILEKSHKVFTIPMKGNINSLNLSTSVSAFLFNLDFY